jgi:biopolymer transport protein ExbD
MAGGGGNEPNLTPFIDLFSVLICFLLMTAAWLQLETVQVNIEKPNPKDVAAATPEPTPDDKAPKVSLSVFLYPDRVVAQENEQQTPIGHLGGVLNEDGLVRLLQTWRAKFPDKKDIVLKTEATVTYGQMIRLYDLIVGADWPEVGISPN